MVSHQLCWDAGRSVRDELRLAQFFVPWELNLLSSLQSELGLWDWLAWGHRLVLQLEGKVQHRRKRMLGTNVE